MELLRALIAVYLLLHFSQNEFNVVVSLDGSRIVFIHEYALYQIVQNLQLLWSKLELRQLMPFGDGAHETLCHDLGIFLESF
jgi:hypothetical protein